MGKRTVYGSKDRPKDLNVKLRCKERLKQRRRSFVREAMRPKWEEMTIVSLLLQPIVVMKLLKNSGAKGHSQNESFMKSVL
jgi:hypothetical protein